MTKSFLEMKIDRTRLVKNGLFEMTMGLVPEGVRVSVQLTRHDPTPSYDADAFVIPVDTFMKLEDEELVRLIDDFENRFLSEISEFDQALTEAEGGGVECND